MFAVM